MATFVTHLVIGERVFARLKQEHCPIQESEYGAFLLGCMLVDVNNFNGMDRRETHFVGRLEQDGQDAFRKSCANFVAQLDALLVRPWSDLTPAAQAFVTGYLCHLAADEAWKQRSWEWQRSQASNPPTDPIAPVGVLLTAFDAASTKTYRDSAAIASALTAAAVPHALTHIPHADLVEMWDTIRAHVLDGQVPDSYFKLLQRMGKSKARIERIRREYDLYWQQAVSLLQKMGGVEPILRDSVERSMRIIPHLWDKFK